jgi:probable rRNA maturation factor
LDCPDSELSILIVDDPQIEVLNKKYLNRNGPTNVIAFPMRTGQFSKINPQLLGDVVISVETAAIEGKSAGNSMQERFTHLLVHGILHLLGYDHEKTDREAHKMEKKSNEILKLIE